MSALGAGRYGESVEVDLDLIADEAEHVKILNSPHVGSFLMTTEDLVSLASGVVPEWLRYDADAALDWPKDAEAGVPGLAAQGNHEIPKAPIGFCQKTQGCHGSNTHEGGCWTS